MKCPACGRMTAEVQSTRKSNKESKIRRYRKCIVCKHNFTTDEVLKGHTTAIIGNIRQSLLLLVNQIEEDKDKIE